MSDELSVENCIPNFLVKRVSVDTCASEKFSKGSSIHDIVLPVNPVKLLTKGGLVERACIITGFLKQMHEIVDIIWDVGNLELNQKLIPDGLLDCCPVDSDFSEEILESGLIKPENLVFDSGENVIDLLWVEIGGINSSPLQLS